MQVVLLAVTDDDAVEPVAASGDVSADVRRGEVLARGGVICDAVAARIDTGADSNSLSATNLVFLERDGDDWVRFDLQARDGTHTLEREVRRYVRVFQQSDTAGARRPVVLLRVQLGDILGNFEFSLSDRTHLKHAVILGRSLLMDLILVDVSQQFLQPLPDGEG